MKSIDDIKIYTTSFITDDNGNNVKFKTLGMVQGFDSRFPNQKIESEAIKKFGNDVDVIVDVKIISITDDITIYYGTAVKLV